MLYPGGLHVTLNEVKGLSVSGGVLHKGEILRHAKSLAHNGGMEMRFFPSLCSGQARLHSSDLSLSEAEDLCSNEVKE